MPYVCTIVQHIIELSRNTGERKRPCGTRRRRSREQAWWRSENRGAVGGVYLRWTPADIAVGAAVGVACGVIFQGFNFIYPVLSSLLGAILPGLASLFHAIWYASGVFAVLVIRKPGAAIYVNLVGSFAEW